MKRCSRCGIEKPESGFNASTKDGLQAQCRDCSRASSREWYAKNKQRHLETGNRWAENNRERILLHERTYRQAHPDYDRRKNQTRRSRLRGGIFTQDELDAIKHEQTVGGCIRCFYCGDDITNTYQVEHVVPVSRGGSNTIDNIVLACPPCNQSKGSKLLSEWEGR